MPPRLIPILALFALAGCQPAPSNPRTSLMTSPLPPVYSPDNLDGTFHNPIIFADYSDPDVCRVGDDYYMTASSFSCFPGLPILHSRDLVHWQLVGHALPRYPAPLDENFNAPAHGKGVWAPSIRFHNNRFWIFFGDPDLGIFMTTAQNPAGPWAPLTRVKEAKGWIDCCPLWDDDAGGGNAYLVHAFANSRAGIANVLDICRMSPDGTRLLDEGTRIYDGGQTGTANRTAAPAFAAYPKYTTVEGPKLYKRNGFYYVMAPGGGVTGGYQIVFRSKNILGPYDSRIVLDQGTTKINGPHQGGWVTTPTIAGKQEDWFIHFQEILPYGRILHLQPVQWQNDWPVMGNASANATKGEPVLTLRRPDQRPGELMQMIHEAEQEQYDPSGTLARSVPQTSDDFDLPTLGLQWQWWANFNPDWSSLIARPGFLRLTPVSMKQDTLLYNRPNLLLQKFPAESFTVTARLDASALAENETAGLILAGKTISSLTCSKTPAGIKVSRTNYNANNTRQTTDTEETSLLLPPPANANLPISTPREPNLVYLRMKVAPRGICTFQVSSDGAIYTDLGTPVAAINAQWIGAKVGLFCNASPNTTPKGHADFDYFHIEK